jgi:hypothetical protein
MVLYIPKKPFGFQSGAEFIPAIAVGVLVAAWGLSWLVISPAGTESRSPSQRMIKEKTPAVDGSGRSHQPRGRLKANSIAS